MKGLYLYHQHIWFYVMISYFCNWGLKPLKLNPIYTNDISYHLPRCSSTVYNWKVSLQQLSNQIHAKMAKPSSKNLICSVSSTHLFLMVEYRKSRTWFFFFLITTIKCDRECELLDCTTKRKFHDMQQLSWTHKQQQNSPWTLYPYLGSAVLNLKSSLQSSAVLVTSARKNNSAIFSSTTVENFKTELMLSWSSERNRRLLLEYYMHTNCLTKLIL